MRWKLRRRPDDDFVAARSDRVRVHAAIDDLVTEMITAHVADRHPGLPCKSGFLNRCLLGAPQDVIDADEAAQRAYAERVRIDTEIQNMANKFAATVLDEVANDTDRVRTFVGDVIAGMDDATQDVYVERVRDEMRRIRDRVW